MAAGFQPGTPKQLFKLPGEVLYWDATRNGQKFLIPVPSSAESLAPYRADPSRGTIFGCWT
jgi:hypothetical protein